MSAGTVLFRDGRISQGKLLPERAVPAKGGSAVERYVVRIYRRDAKDPKNIFGTVEWVTVTDWRVFSVPTPS